MTKIYVGNLPFTATEADVKELFAQHGNVDSVALPTDRETGRPRGFGFVEMPQADAQRAMQALNGFNMGGRPLRVNEAQDRPRTGGGGGGPRGGGGGRPGGWRRLRRWWRRRRLRWWRRRRSASLVRPFEADAQAPASGPTGYQA